MAFNEAQALSLLQGLQRDNPRAYELFRLIIANLSDVNVTLYPPAESPEIIVPEPEVVPDVTEFTYELLLAGISLEWNRPDPAIVYFEIRKGSDWDTSPRVLVTSTLSAVVPPELVGTHRYLIKGIGLEGGYSANALAVDVVIPPIGAITLTAQVIDNNVLFFWNVPVSAFQLTHYVLYKGGVEIGQITGTFATTFEQVSGSYTYSVVAVDIAGNVSPEAEVVAQVNQPPDYILRATYTSDLNGTRVQCTRIDGPRLVACTRVETWDEHFADRGWNTIQDQIAAGFPYYIQPAQATASYEEVVDYGLIITNVIITVSYNVALIDGSGVTIIVKIAVSDDNVTFTSFSTGSTYFAASVRYAKVRIEFTAID